MIAISFFCVRKFEGALRKDSKIVQTRSMEKIGKNAIPNDAAMICREHGLNETDDVDILVAHWSSLFFSVIEKHAPSKSIRLSEKFFPWVNRNLKS